MNDKKQPCPENQVQNKEAQQPETDKQQLTAEDLGKIAGGIVK